jgi:hypothetical protein
MRQSIGSSLSNVNLQRLHHFVMDRGRDGSPEKLLPCRTAHRSLAPGGAFVHAVAARWTASNAARGAGVNLPAACFGGPERKRQGRLVPAIGWGKTMCRNLFFHCGRLSRGTDSVHARSRACMLLIISRLSALFLMGVPVDALATDDAPLCLQPSAEGALAACNRVIESGASTGRALAAFYVSRAAIWQAQHQVARCLEDVSQAVSLDPTWVTPVLDRAAIYLQQGQYDRSPSGAKLDRSWDCVRAPG